MNTTRHDPRTDTAAAHRRRHEQSHAEAELYDNPAARQHASEPVPVPDHLITAAMVAAAQAYDLAHRRESGERVWTAVPDLQVARFLAGAAPAIREAARTAGYGRGRDDEAAGCLMTGLLAIRLAPETVISEAVAAAVTAERDRIRQLAELYDAVYTEDGGAEWHRFAGLLGGGS